MYWDYLKQILKEVKMKKTNIILALVLVFVMLFSFAGCGGGNDTAGDNKEQQQQTQVDQNDDKQDETDVNDADKDDASTNQDTSSNTDQNDESDKKEEAPTAPTAADAKAYIGKSLSSLISAIGSPVSSQYSPSCMGDGEDGELVYNGFTVYTYKEGGSEKVVDVA